MPSPARLQCGVYYHIFNRGINGETLFAENRNYLFFMQRYARYIEPVAFTYAYCLMRNHFHLLVRIKTPEEQRNEKTLKVSETFRVLEPSRQFSNLFNAYAKAFNKLYSRTGSLFEHPFHRIEIKTDAYFQSLVAYIHRNPQKHGFVDDFRVWPYSSYQALTSRQPTRVQREAVLEWFGGLNPFLEFHASGGEEDAIRSVVLEDWRP